MRILNLDREAEAKDAAETVCIKYKSLTVIVGNSNIYDWNFKLQVL